MIFPKDAFSTDNPLSVKIIATDSSEGVDSATYYFTVKPGIPVPVVNMDLSYF